MTGSVTAARTSVIHAEGITKSFGERLALRGVSLDINRGECVAVLGPNGAGKTTLLRILATIANPSSGVLAVNGLEAKKHADEVRRSTGMVAHHTYLYRDLTGYENLRFYGLMYGVRDLDERIREVAGMVGMGSRLDDRTGTLSRGMQQRLSVARALLHNPSLMLLDEPETGLDVDAFPALWELIRHHGGKPRTVVFTTHDLDRGYELSDRILIINRGRLVRSVTRQETDAAGLREIYREATEETR